jgi:hypothetical protein
MEKICVFAQLSRLHFSSIREYREMIPWSLAPQIVLGRNNTSWSPLEIFFLISISVLSQRFTLESSMVDCCCDWLKLSDYYMFFCVFWVFNSFKMWNAHEFPSSTWFFGSIHIISSLILISCRYSNFCYIDSKTF